RARDMRQRPAYLLGVAQGSEYRNAARGHNAPTYASSSFTTVAPHLWEMAGLGPKDVDVVQSYENFTGGVLMSLVEHGFFAPEESNEFLTFENLVAPHGRLPLNTSGGNLAECYMHGRPLTPEAYDESRWIVEPFRLFDCCMENDGAAALVLVSAERARDMRQRPAYLLGVAQGSEYRNAARGHNAPTYASSSFTTVAPHLYAMAGVTPKDVSVVQSYENFTGGVLMSLVEHDFFAADEANEFLTLENLIAPTGRLPLNTSGGNLAECYMHGLELQIEAVRQLRGQSSNPVPGARVAMVISGPMVTPVSSMLIGTEDVL
ncbi:MAG TPA: hypothetical protein VFE97_14495, partial [Methylomirabilota bacterium]|nr:hypothetical protein [Methylomirabilota bacterium]